MFCKNCGTQNADGVKFCRNCGAPQGQVSATPNPGYTPNRAPVRKNPAPGQLNIMQLIPAIAGGVALICMFLPWYVLSVFGYSDSLTLLEAAFDFGSWSGGFSFVLLTLFSIACIGAAALSVFASLKKLPYAKFVAIGGAVIGLLTLFVWKSCAASAMSQLAEYAKGGFGFYLYIIVMAVSGVVNFLNEKK